MQTNPGLVVAGIATLFLVLSVIFFFNGEWSGGFMLLLISMITFGITGFFDSHQAYNKALEEQDRKRAGL